MPVDIFVSGYTGSDWKENLEVIVACLVGEPQHTNNEEPNVYKGNALPRAEVNYSFTFTPQTPSVWAGRWVKLIAHNKKNNTWSASQYIKITPINDDEGIVINGIRWATRNVDIPGTFAVKPESFGMFYQWNRKIGWSNTDPMINSNGGTTWDGSISAGSTWEKANDPCPTGWRVPNHGELQSLINSGSQWTTLNGIGGRYFGSGDQRVFFPVAGCRDYREGTLSIEGSRSYYWSYMPYDSESAYCLFSLSNNANIYKADRSYGLSVRCVKE